ncbi:MAG: glycosyl hydrolase 53 family protein [Lachnospiraceae bacterium]|nr:glycosyl hydrolase 53 family protein [Candidatus Colinaster scatohippi]
MNNSVDFIKGMDVSTLVEEEKCGARYYDNGKEKDMLEILKSYNCNYIRLRLWNDPYDENGSAYGAGTNDLETTIIIGKRAKACGLKLLLDYHYSDFWTDPGKQNVPKAWRGLDINGLKKALYEYTVSTLESLKAEGVTPDMVQVGNEITNGLLWPYGKKPEYDNIAELVSTGIRAVREVCPEAEIMIHLDAGGNNSMYVDWFDNYFKRGEDFDIIGMSYYPFWHGPIRDLEYNMRDMAERYGKKIVIAEVSMGFTMDDYAEYEGLGPNERKGYATKKELVEKIEYPMSVEGQSNFMKDIMTLIKSVPGGYGFFYWEPGWIPVRGCGWATNEALKYTGEKGPCGNEWANQALFNYDGNALDTLKVIRDFR